MRFIVTAQQYEAALVIVTVVVLDNRTFLLIVHIESSAVATVSRTLPKAVVRHLVSLDQGVVSIPGPDAGTAVPIWPPVVFTGKIADADHIILDDSAGRAVSNDGIALQALQVIAADNDTRAALGPGLRGARTIFCRGANKEYATAPDILNAVVLDKYVVEFGFRAAQRFTDDGAAGLGCAAELHQPCNIMYV